MEREREGNPYGMFKVIGKFRWLVKKWVLPYWTVVKKSLLWPVMNIGHFRIWCLTAWLGVQLQLRSCGVYLVRCSGSEEHKINNPLQKKKSIKILKTSLFTYFYFYLFFFATVEKLKWWVFSGLAFTTSCGTKDKSEAAVAIGFPISS